MIAVVEIGGKQYTVTPEMNIIVDRQQAAEGTDVEFAPLLVSEEDGTGLKVGTPFVDGSKVICTVVEHLKGDKVRVFKHKAKKHYTRTIGFRPYQTKLVVKSVA